MTVDQLIRDLKMLPANAVVQVRIYGTDKSRSIIHGPYLAKKGVIELILDRDDRGDHA